MIIPNNETKSKLVQLGNKQIDLSKVTLTSRSAVACYRHCAFKRWLQYHCNGTGIVPKRKSIPLSTGSHVHEGCGHMFSVWLEVGKDAVLGQLPDLTEEAVKRATEKYRKDVTSVLGLGAATKKQVEYTLAEQCALIEVLTRVWAHIEFPGLVKFYEIYSTEKEMLMPLVEDKLYLQGRVDAILRHPKGDYINYNIKTTRRWSEKLNQKYSIDIQLKTEQACVNYNLDLEAARAIRDNNRTQAIVPYLIKAGKEELARKVEALAEKYIPIPPTKVAGTRYCCLVKGDRKVDENRDNWRFTNNPFTRGYRHQKEMTFAHSYWYPNPETGGNSRLGAGWEPFYVWEDYKGGVKQWFQDIVKGKIQRVIDPKVLVSEHCISPPDKFVHDSEVVKAVQQVRTSELEVQTKLQYPGEGYDVAFVQNTDSCVWPDYCEYIPWCHGVEPFTWNPLPPGEITELYEPRVPHHEYEREQLEYET